MHNQFVMDDYGPIRPNEQIDWVDEYGIRCVKNWRPCDPCKVCYGMWLNRHVKRELGRNIVRKFSLWILSPSP